METDNNVKHIPNFIEIMHSIFESFQHILVKSFQILYFQKGFRFNKNKE